METEDLNQNTLFIEIADFSVDPVSVYDYSNTAKVASVWANTAREKASLAIAGNQTPSEFYANASICESIKEGLYLECFPWLENTSKFFLCKDTTGKVQGMMELSIKRDEIYIELLVTNPVNIRSKVNEEEEGRVKGAGTSMLKKAEELAVRLHKNSVSLHPLLSAVGFYEKNGFTFDDEGWMMRKEIRKTEKVAGEILSLQVA